jgi:hypothetical protein
VFEVVHLIKSMDDENGEEEDWGGGGGQIRQTLPQNVTVTIMLLGEGGRTESD